MIQDGVYVVELPEFRPFDREKTLHASAPHTCIDCGKHLEYPERFLLVTPALAADEAFQAEAQDREIHLILGRECIGRTCPKC